MTSAKKERKFAGCPSEGGCSGYGVLEPSRGKGPPTATQQLASNMKGAQVDLSRATGNAMLGVGMHPYRLTKGDQRKPTTASSMFLQDMHANSTPPPSHGGRMAMDGAGKQVTQPGIASSVPIAPPPPVQAPPDPFGGGPDPIGEVEGAGAGGVGSPLDRLRSRYTPNSSVDRLRSRVTTRQSPNPSIMEDSDVFFVDTSLGQRTNSRGTPDVRTEPLPRNRRSAVSPASRSILSPTLNTHFVNAQSVDRHHRQSDKPEARRVPRARRALDLLEPADKLNKHEK